MKRILILVAIFIFAITNVCDAKQMLTDKVNQGIQMYKSKNYTECLQVLHEALDEDPSNVLAYYYVAIARARLGDTEKAIEAYQRVIDINSSTQLSNYAKNGIACLNDISQCKSEFGVDPAKKAMDAVNKQIEDKKIDTVKDIVNQKQQIQEVPIEYMQDFKDFSLPKNQMQNKSEVPTSDEIAQALDTLKRAGYQNYLPQPAMTAEMMQMNMINSLAANNNQNTMNSMSNFMPYMMNSGNMQQIDPQFMQTMMMSSMLNGLYSDFEQK